MKHYEDFCRSGQSFAERIGPADEFDAGMGRIALAFCDLEDAVRRVSHLLMGITDEIASVATAELSFKQRVELVGALALMHVARLPGEDQEAAREQLSEILYLCRRSEELRNTYLHSSYSYPGPLRRVKVTARAKRGLHVHVESIDPNLLLDVADFIGSTAVICQDELPGVLGVADGGSSGPNGVAYTKDGRVIAEFKTIP
jgi:hypothetical protein